MIPLLGAAEALTPSTSGTKKLNNSKVAPIISKATLISNKSSTQPASIKPSMSGFKPYTVSSAPITSKSSVSAAKPSASSSASSSKDDKRDNKKGESADKKKKEEKMKLKAEKEAKKVKAH